MERMSPPQKKLGPVNELAMVGVRAGESLKENGERADRSALMVGITTKNAEGAPKGERFCDAHGEKLAKRVCQSKVKWLQEEINVGGWSIESCIGGRGRKQRLGTKKCEMILKSAKFGSDDM